MNRRTSKLIFLSLICLIAPSPAYAYLDPGSGSALLGTILSLIGFVAYSVKSLFYKITKKSCEPEIKFNNSVILFSEGRNYFSTFDPIIRQLIDSETPFRYITLDLYDPALTIDNEYMQSQLIHPNRFNLVKLEKLQAPLMLSTTPNIGTAGYPIKRPKDVRNLCHIFHSATDISIYKKYSLDHYDSVILSGAFQEASIRKIEQVRDLKPKEFYYGGLPYLDTLQEEIETAKLIPSKNQKKDKHTILIGSSWGAKGCLITYDINFIEELAQKDYNIIIRPHPQSLIVEKDIIKSHTQRLEKYPNIIWDHATSPVESMLQADLLISDLSSLRIDFALLCERPVVTLDIPTNELKGYEAEDLNSFWSDKISPQLGPVLTLEEQHLIVQTVEQALQTKAHNLQKLKEVMVPYLGESANLIKKIIQKQTTEII